MQELTQEQAERCARACWGEQIDDGIFIYWDTGEDGEWPASCELPLDPYFWFGRLWDRLEGKLVPSEGHHEAMTDEPMALGLHTNTDRVYTVIIELWNHELVYSPVLSHPCLALCAAIETLLGGTAKEE